MRNEKARLCKRVPGSGYSVEFQFGTTTRAAITSVLPGAARDNRTRHVASVNPIGSSYPGPGLRPIRRQDCSSQRITVIAKATVLISSGLLRIKWSPPNSTRCYAAWKNHIGQ